MALAESLRIVLAPPHPAGRPFIVGGLVVAVVGLLVSLWLVWLGVIFAVFCLYFFRDPERVPPGRANAVLAPADGHVVSVMTAVPPAELDLGDTPRWRVAIFLSVLDVHVNRMPVAGTVTRIAYRHGKFVSANLDKASADNERNSLVIATPGARVAVVQIAGLIARRIVCFAREQQPMGAGERFGMIRFGSRLDVYLPEGTSPLVAIGQTSLAGETVLADLKANGEARAFRAG